MVATSIYSAGRESYPVSQILSVSSVGEIPQEHRKGDATHSFRMLTTRGVAFSYHKSYENANKARCLLIEMLLATKPDMYKHGLDLLDPSAVTSFGNVVALKQPQGEYTHAFTVTINCPAEHNKVWLRYKSQENAEKGRRAFYAVMHSRESKATVEQKQEAEAVAQTA